MNSSASPNPNPTLDRRWLHYFAVLTACATFPLILLGGLVTSYDVGMAVPDAPTTFGRNLLLYPVREWLNAPRGVFLEHGHRLFGALVGLLTLILAAGFWAGSPARWLPWLGGLVLAAVFARGSLGPKGLLMVGGFTVAGAIVLWVRQPLQWSRWLGLVALGLVIVQGGFGAQRVVRNEPVLAVVHGCVAQAFFALTVCLALFTSRTWTAGPARQEASDAGRLQRLAVTTTGFVFLQLIFGAVLRHIGIFWTLWAHLAIAFVIVVHVALLAKRVFTQCARQAVLVKPVEILGVLTLIQLMLGVGAWATSSGFGLDATTSATRAQAFFATAHVGLGALMLATCVVLTIDCYRYFACRASPESAPQVTNPAPESCRSQPDVSRPAVTSLETRELLMLEGTA